MPPELETNGSSNLHTKWSSCHSIDSVRNEHTTGSRLCSVNSDGTQIVEIRKSQNKAIDFFISRGNSQFKHGKLYTHIVVDTFAVTFLAIFQNCPILFFNWENMHQCF